MPCKLHIISFDVPYPPDYGGAVDVFYQVKALWESGCDIYLHCYSYGRAASAELAQYCKEVWYYPRRSGMGGMRLPLPYIVSSRRSPDMLQRLLSIDAPILYQGVHTLYHHDHPGLRHRIKVLRPANVEHTYYRLLASKETNMFRRTYYAAEAALLQHYEKRLYSINSFASLSLTDSQWFQRRYPRATHAYVPGFHDYGSVKAQVGTGAYCLYHGNLAHPENIEAVHWLLKHVIPRIGFPFVIAGRRPHRSIIEACRRAGTCQLIADPDMALMDSLITNAQVHLLPTFQPTGMKLKLLYALFGGRHVVATPDMLVGTRLHDACSVGTNAVGFTDHVARLVAQPFTIGDIELRRQQLSADYSNTVNAGRIIALLA